MRRTVPDTIELIPQHVKSGDLTTYEGIPSTTVKRALLDCRDIIMVDRLVEAAEEAGRRGLVTRHQLAALLDQLNAAR